MQSQAKSKHLLYIYTKLVLTNGKSKVISGIKNRAIILIEWKQEVDVKEVIHEEQKLYPYQDRQERKDQPSDPRRSFGRMLHTSSCLYSNIYPYLVSLDALMPGNTILHGSIEMMRYLVAFFNTGHIYGKYRVTFKGSSNWELLLICTI